MHRAPVHSADTLLWKGTAWPPHLHREHGCADASVRRCLQFLWVQPGARWPIPWLPAVAALTAPPVLSGARTRFTHHILAASCPARLTVDCLHQPKLRPSQKDQCTSLQHIEYLPAPHEVSPKISDGVHLKVLLRAERSWAGEARGSQLTSQPVQGMEVTAVPRTHLHLVTEVRCG